MGLRGLPALLQAVPVRFFKRLRSVSTARPAGNSDLLGLVGRLPPELRERALTHSSWVDSRLQSYERLEFLGDSVLGLAITAALHQRHPDRDEGELARMKGFVVSRASCAEVAEKLDLRGLVEELGPASLEKRREAAANQTILGNILEALIGAVFLTYGFDRTQVSVVDAFDMQIRQAATTQVDHKTALQELLAARGLQPIYRVVEEQGPPHARIFTSEVYVAGVTRGRGTGTTIKMSEQVAAAEALQSHAVTGTET